MPTFTSRVEYKFLVQDLETALRDTTTSPEQLADSFVPDNNSGLLSLLLEDETLGTGSGDDVFDIIRRNVQQRLRTAALEN
jgi:hypothetical protein